jgi:hypothetical protein
MGEVETWTKVSLEVLLEFPEKVYWVSAWQIRGVATDSPF